MALKTEEKPDKSPPLTPKDEAQAVLWNRFENFKELLPDIDEDCIKELTKATTEVSPHDIRKLLNAGCSQELAVKICKPI